MDKNVMKGSTPKISVIIPVYNTQNYLGRCLQSLLNQTFSDFELICVDDGSTDTSGAICDAYGKKDERIRVFHMKNGGVGSARNYGLSMMRGEWFAFVDSDDWVEPDFLKLLYENAVGYDADVAACLYDKGKHDVKKGENSYQSILVFETIEARVYNFICGNPTMEGMCANKLYRSSCLHNIRFAAEIRVNEDCIYTMDVMERCKKAVLIPLKMYHWTYRSESLSHWKKGEADFSAANVFLALLQRTAKFHNTEMERVLKKNYVCTVVSLLIQSKYRWDNVWIQDAVSRCKTWRSFVWSQIDGKEKVKFVLAIYCSASLKILKALIRKS